MADMALQRRLLGQRDSRGMTGMLSRGANVYNGASMSAQSGGGPQFGRPRTNFPQISSSQNVQPNLQNSLQSNDGQSGTGQEMFIPQNLNPQPVNLLAAMQRRLLGSANGNKS